MFISLKKLGFSVVFAYAAYSISPMAVAIESKDWLIRSHFINVYPNDQINAITANGSFIQSAGMDIEDSYTIDANITYMVAKHWGVEFFADFSSKHILSANDNSFFQGRIGETRLLPSALMLQYHLVPDATISPYAGLGAHYALFFDEKPSSALNTLESVPTLKFDNTVGLVAQIGADYNVDNDWFFNIDFKYLNVDTSANFTSTMLGEIDMDMDIDPWIIGFGMGRRF